MVLAGFRPGEELRGVAEIAQELGFSRSTTFRYMATLREIGYLEHGAGRKYRLASHAANVGLNALNSTGLRQPARPLLEQLRLDTGGLPVGLGVLDGTRMVYVEHLPSATRGHINLEQPQGPGTRLPAQTTALGKSILAQLTPDHLAALLQLIYPPTPPSRVQRTNTRRPSAARLREALESELTQIRRRGVALQDPGGPDGGLAAIAACVPTPLHLLALDITAPAGTSASQLSQAHATTLMAAAQRLTATLAELPLEPFRRRA